MKKINLKIKELAKKHDLPESIVKEIYESQFRFMREKVQALDLRNTFEEEEFDKLKTNFNFKYLGKFYTKWSIVNNLNTHRLKQNGEDKNS